MPRKPQIIASNMALYRHLVSIAYFMAMALISVGQNKDSSTYSVLWERVDSTIEVGDYLDAVNMLDSIVIDVEEGNIDIDKKYFYWYSGLANYWLKRYGPSEINLEEGITYVDSTDILAMTDYWSLLGTANVAERDRGKAEFYLNRIIEHEELLMRENPKAIITAYGDRSSMYQIFGENTAADADMQKALLLLTLSEYEDVELEGNFNLNLASGYLERSLLDSAFVYLIRAKKKYIEVLSADHYKHGSVLFNLSVYYSNKGNLNASVDCLKACENNWKLNYGDVHPRIAILHINKASSLLELKSFEKVLDNCYKACKILDSLSISIPQYDKAIYNNMALAFEGLSDLDQAEVYYNQAGNIIKKTFGIESVPYIHNRSFVAKLASKKGDFDYSLELSFENMQILKDYPNDYLESLTLLHLADVYAKMEDRELQIHYLDLALENHQLSNSSFYPGKMDVLLSRMQYFIEGEDISSSLQVNKEISELIHEVSEKEAYSISPYLLSRFSALKASLAMKRYSSSKNVLKLEEANSEYLSAIDYLINWKTGLTVDESVVFELAEEERLFSKAMASIYTSSEYTLNSSVESALYISNNSKNYQLKRDIRRKQIFNQQLISQDFYLKELELRSLVTGTQAEINDLYLENSDSIDEARIIDLRSKLVDSETELNDYIELVSSDYPAYYKQNFDQTPRFNLRKIKEILPANGALLDFCVLDSSLYIIYISKSSTNIRKQSFTEFDRKGLREFHKSISDFQNSNYKRYVELWSNRLLQDVKVDVLDIDKLIILPDDELSFIPFEILNLDASQLVQTVNVSYAWSIEQLIELNVNKTNNEKLLGFAPSYEINSEQDHKLYASLVRSGELALPWAKLELENIDNIWKIEKYLGTEATEHAFKSLCNEYDILHLSMHGLVDEDNSLNSALLFNSELDSLEDGLLYSHEIYNLPMQAKLAVLSACNTGFGKLERSEGVMSMSRSFAAAGVPSTVMSLWKVPDQSTSMIMTSFYDHLHKGNEIDVSLRLAKLDYLNSLEAPEYAHPKYWAGFVLTGNRDAVVSTFFTSNLAIGALLILVLILFGVWKFKKK